MRKASARATKYQKAKNAYIDRLLSNSSVVKPRLTLGDGTPARPFSPPVKSDSGLNSR